MDVQEVMEHAIDSITVRRVYGEPYEKNGITIIPAAVVSGGGGGGSGAQPPAGNGHPTETPAGTGGGVGMGGRPVGAFVINGTEVRWVPAVDVSRIVLRAMGLAMAVVLISALRRRTRD